LKCGAREGRRRSVGNEVLRRIKVERNVLYTITRRKTSWIGHILCRNCLLNTLLKEE
jgi:hypothetical protein